ncbi:transcriptional regulator [Longimycelium tulufanense]|uniref:Transcriptional regulator n=1 Tax=Longimycelium tulufanense TaxID=907463 RepID=A0A8J3C7M5_9PSEU|nr:helix-turn-helix domain-containing protein [Longimycelium tulufanense]GGM50708.1 transcriptional regulator [Longimycelium tulufanense]
MRSDLADKTIGERIRTLRGKLLTQQQLADMAQVSVALIRKLEQGRRHTASIGSLQRIARALDVDIAVLVGKRGSLPPSSPDEGVTAIRRALTPVDDLLGEDLATGEPLGIDEARRTVEYCWGTYWSGHYEALGSLLPAALEQLRATTHAVESDQCVEAHELLARGYWVTGCTLVHLGQQDSAFLSIRHALTAAELGGDPFLAATLRGSVAWQLLVQGRFDESARIALRAASTLEPHGDVSPPHLSCYGSLVITAATAAGRNQRVGQARELLGEADAVARRIGTDRNDYETAFGPSQVTMQTVDVHVVTEHYPEALKEAKDMPRDNGLPLASRARHLADRAFAHARLGHDEKALQAVLTAESMAPDWIKHQALPRQVVAELVERERRVTTPLRTLARRLGVTV